MSDFQTLCTVLRNRDERVPRRLSSQMNDYVAAYHDAVLLIGQVMREIMRQNQSQSQEMEYVNVNYFRNISFNGRRRRCCCCKSFVQSFTSWFWGSRSPACRTPGLLVWVFRRPEWPWPGLADWSFTCARHCWQDAIVKRRRLQAAAASSKMTALTQDLSLSLFSKTRSAYCARVFGRKCRNLQTGQLRWQRCDALNHLHNAW